MQFAFDIEKYEHPWDSVGRLSGPAASEPPTAIMLEYHTKLFSPKQRVHCHLVLDGDKGGTDAPYVMNGQVAQRKGNSCVISCGGLLLKIDREGELPEGLQLQRRLKVGLTPV